MGWTERQQAMLQEMGIRLWPQPEPQPAVERTDSAEAVVTAVAAVTTVSEAVHADTLAVAPPAGSIQRPMPVRARADAAGPDRRTEPVARIAVPGSARAGDVAAMNWPTLAATVAACRECGLCEGRQQTVFGVGHTQAHWMLVGEAPGEHEDQQGQPFVGKAGQLLDNMLRALGLTREAGEPAQQVYLANVLKCRPPGNRNPEPAEIARCEPYLQRQVALVRPRVIVAMGRFAVQSLLRSSEPIGRLRGKRHDYQGVPLVVTYHPAYLLRNPLDKARAWEDLCLARELLNGA
ncbi:MAG: uracil-DNA glycosylase family protein [Leptothrix sp. (in: b-proteobacteria)]